MRKDNTMFAKTKKAFTIVELVIVIAVIAILMGIMFVGGTAISNNAKASTLDSDMRTFETNIKAMINDPDAHCIQTKAAGIDVTEASVANLLAKYFEGDMAATFADSNKLITAADSGPKAQRSAWETPIAMDDPYGMPYQLVVLDDSDTNNTDITFFVYSYGKNKQTATQPAGSFDADDVGFFVQVYDSVIYTGDMGPDVKNGDTPLTNGTDSLNGKAYKDAIDNVSPASAP